MLPLPTAPMFLATPKNTIKALKGSEVTLDCVANGYPMPEMLWLKDGASIDLKNPRLSLRGSASLSIKNVQEQDVGTYQCRAENSQDSIDAAAVLQVQRPPSFVQRPQNTVALEKGDIQLTCQVEGEPRPTVQWYKNGDLIIESEYFQVRN